MPTQPTSARPLVAISWMLVTGLLFVGVTALVKHIGDGVPATEAAFLRYALGLVFILPMVRPMLREGLSRTTMKLVGFRGFAHGIGVTLWFFAMTQITIAEVVSIGYLSPVFITVGAALFLGERLALRRILAVLVALAGAVIILRPGFRTLELGHLAILANGFFFATSYLLAKVLADRMPAVVVVGWLSVLVPIVLAPFAWAVWVWPSWEQLGWLFLVAALATTGHTTMTLALRAAPVAVTQPVTFLQLVWASILGALVFAEPVDRWVIFGGVLILGSVCFIAWREYTLKRRAVTPPVHAAKN